MNDNGKKRFIILVPGYTPERLHLLGRDEVAVDDRDDRPVRIYKCCKKNYGRKLRVRGLQRWRVKAGNTKGGSITVPLTSCLTGLNKNKNYQ